MGSSAARDAAAHRRTEIAAVRHRRVTRRAGGWAAGRTNTVLQTCFFAISGVLPREQAMAHIKQAIRKSYGAKGEQVVQANFRAVDDTLARLFEVQVPAATSSTQERTAGGARRCTSLRA